MSARIELNHCGSYNKVLVWGSKRVLERTEEFSKEIRYVLRNPFGEREASAAVAAAKKNSWTDRLEKMAALIERTASEKAKERERFWKANITRIYKTTRKKVIPVAASLIALYIVLFHTALIWTIAAPLQIKDVPKDADVVMALGGGVGESRKVGQRS